MFICLFIAVLYCYPSVDSISTLKDDTLLTKHFSPEEVEQLDSIRGLFNNFIRSTCEDTETIDGCYQEFFNRLSNNAEKGIEYSISVPYSEQQRLYEHLDKKLFESIWQRSEPRATSPSTGKLETYHSIDINAQGRYMDYLKDVSKEEPYFGLYIEPIVASGSLSPSLTSGMLYNPSGLDFSNKRHQLILAIHFLTFNDQDANRPK